MRIGLNTLVLIASTVFGAAAEPRSTSEAGAWRLLAHAQSRAQGIYLDEIAESPASPLPHLRLSASPAVGQFSVLTRAQLTTLLAQTAPELGAINWLGSPQVRVTRRMRVLSELEVKELVTSVLQREFIKERGELDLRFTRPWINTSIPDEPFTLNILDLPSAGVTPSFVARFELRSSGGALGSWQVPVQARVWREVWVAGSALQRGQRLESADLSKERRDLLAIRDPIPVLDHTEAAFEIAENLPAGATLTTRSIRLRPVVLRGNVVDALVQEGCLTITIKAEVLEDGLPGQIVRARNLRSKREFRGKVQNEETILVAM